MAERVVIASTARTPFTRASKGELKDTRPDTLAAHVITAAIARVPGLKPADIEDVVLGCAMPEAEQGMNVARPAALLAGLPQVVPATAADWDAEYLAPIISIKVVAGLDEAIAHINRHGSHHTDAILTRDHANAMRFLREVDSASVMVNASTRFADGFEYGLGAEIGISTDKFHARGPVGLEGLTSLKWIVLGQGELRA